MVNIYNHIMENKLIFYSSSKYNKIEENKNDFINNPDEYLELNKIKNFRRYLFNFHNILI